MQAVSDEIEDPRSSAVPVRSPIRGTEIEVVVFSLLTIAVSSFLMFWNLGATPFWVDEAIAVLPARSILTEGVPRNPFDLNFMEPQLEDGLWDPSAPLYRYSVAAVASVFGFSETSTRAWSVFLALLMLLACFLLFRRLYDATTALLAVAFLSSMPAFADFAREARHFTFVASTMAFAFYFLVDAATGGRERSRALWPVFLIASLLGHALGYLALPIVVAFLLLAWRRPLLSKRYIPVYAMAIGLYAAILAKYWKTLPFVNSIGCYNHSAGCHPEPYFYLGVLVSFLNGGDLAPAMPPAGAVFNLLVPLGSLAIGLVASAAALRDPSELRPGRALVVLWFFVPLIVLSTRDVKFPRYLVYVLPSTALFLARGVVEVSGWRRLSPARRPLRAIVALTLVLAPRLSSAFVGGERTWKLQLQYVAHARETSLNDETDNWQHMRAQVDFLRTHVAPGDIVVTSLDDGSLGYYLGRFVYGFLNSEHDDPFFVALLEEASRRGSRLWFIDTLPTYNYCQTPGLEPRNIDCRVKYRRFYESCLPSSPTFDPTCARLRFD